MSLHRIFLVVAVLAAVAPLRFEGRALAAPHAFAVGAIPTWVSVPDLGPLPDVATGDVPNGAHTLLLDRQTRVSASGAQRYYRRAEHILSATGLDAVSQLQLDFEPSYERLTIHFIRIHRDGRVIDQLRPAAIKVIQQESELDDRLYNGTLSAVVFLDDVRVGDVVDYAFSVDGANPVLDGKFADSFYLAEDDPIHRLRFRLLWPQGRTLHRTAQRTDVEPVETQLGGETEFVWDLSDVPSVVFDDDAPDWYDPIPKVQLSEFGTWGDVIEWASPLFKVDEPLSPGLLRQIDAWKAASDDPARRLVEATRFVQDEVRYLGIELGPYSHLPNEPSTVFERRFGDCKDKALLLVTMLRMLGIEAYPALVNTDSQQALDSWQPSPFAFNHCITQVILDGKIYWIDATISLQRGDLDEYYNPSFARALVVRDGSHELTSIPPPLSDRPTIEVASIYALVADGPGATLDVTTTYRGPEADEMRYRLTQHSRAEVGRYFLNYYATTDPSIEADGLPRIEDDPASNTVVITEKYRIPRFWEAGERQIFADRIENELDEPRISRRTMPLAVSFPVHVVQRIEVRLGRDPGVGEDSGTIDDGAIRFDYKYTIDGTALVLDYTLRTLRDNVEPNQVRVHLQTLEKIRKNLEFKLDEEATRVSTGTLVWLAIMLCFVIGPLTIGLVRKRGQRPNDPLEEAATEKPKVVRGEPGLGPETALAVEVGDLGRHVSTLTCTCGSRYQSDAVGGDRQSLTFDGKRMVVVGLACSSCGHSRDLYFVPGPGSA